MGYGVRVRPDRRLFSDAPHERPPATTGPLERRTFPHTAHPDTARTDTTRNDTARPDDVYGANGSFYQKQGLRLGKHFANP